MNKLFLLASCMILLAFTAKAQINTKRLIAHSYYANGSLLDSNHYAYSNGRGSLHNSLDSYEDSYVPNGLNSQSIFSDSSMRWNNLLPMLPTTVSWKIYLYDTAGRTIRMTTVTNTVMHYDMTYDTANRLETMTWSSSLGGSPVIPRSKHYYQYDAQGKLVKDSTFELVLNKPLQAIWYMYDMAGNKILESGYAANAGVWTEFYRHEFLYDNQNRLLRVIRYGTPSGSAMISTSLDTFGYTGTISQEFTYMETNTRNPSNTQWLRMSRSVRTLNSQNRIDQYDTHEWNGVDWDTLDRAVCVYYNDGSLQYIKGYPYLGGGVFDNNVYSIHTYYYENYLPLDTRTLKNDNNILLVYPNPAQDEIAVDITGHATTYALFTTDGKMMEQGMIPGNRVVSVKRLSPGSYVLTICRKGSNAVSAILYKQ